MTFEACVACGRKNRVADSRCSTVLVRLLECPRSRGIPLEFLYYSLWGPSLLRGGSTSGSTTYYLHSWCPRTFGTVGVGGRGDGVTWPPPTDLTPPSFLLAPSQFFCEDTRSAFLHFFFIFGATRCKLIATPLSIQTLIWIKRMLLIIYNNHQIAWCTIFLDVVGIPS